MTLFLGMRPVLKTSDIFILLTKLNGDVNRSRATGTIFLLKIEFVVGVCSRRFIVHRSVAKATTTNGPERKTLDGYCN